MGHANPSQYWWVGADTDRTLSLTGWIGETPEGDVPFLLLYPNAMGAAARMRLLADILELRPGSEGAPVATHQASVTIDNGGDRLELRFPGFSTRIPINAEYDEATRRGWGVLIIGHDGWDGRHGLDKYLSRQNYRRIHHGRIVMSHTDAPAT